MNNFQLNNTSVYLGGQCKWDIVLSHKDDDLEIVGFQLSPISNNIPFNKRGTPTILNDNHSYALKKFCNELKESFWSTDPCLTEHTRDKNYNITGCYDESFVRGLKRSQTYQVYYKQFEYFQPMWLENIDDDQYIRFSFDIYSTNKSGKRSIIDTKILNLKLKMDGDEVIDCFHNSFINYFNNWLKYLNIKGNGNDKVMFVDLQKNIVQLDGVSTNSGQLSGKVSCDYISNNLLSNERPNIETDYILSTAFKNHNVIASQLFNFNFCMDTTDLLDSFLLTQLKGKYVSVDCTVKLIGGEQSITLDKRSLFSNYEYIERDIYNPFIFMADVNQIQQGTSGSITNEYEFNYTTVYKKEIDESSSLESDIDRNVLSYLHDNEIESLIAKNKTTQPIVHWGYVSHLRDTFNLYEGYHPYIVSETIKREKEENNIYYLVKVYESKRVNGISVPLCNVIYSQYNGTLSWFYPKNIMYYDGRYIQDINRKISESFVKFYWTDGNVIRDKCLWKLSESVLGEYADKSNDHYNDSFTFVYTNGGVKKAIFGDGDWIQIYEESDGSGGSWVLFKNSNDTTSNFLIVSNKLQYFTLSELCSADNGARLVDDDFADFVDLIKESVDSYNNAYNFYGFGQELEVGRDDLDKLCYYKALTKNTFVYRKCGKLSPHMIEDPDYDLNYFYCLSSDDESIKKMTMGYPEQPDDEKIYGLRYTFEDCEIGKGKVLILVGNLNYIIDKDVDNPTTLETLIKDKLAETYGYPIENDTNLIDYVYNLYDVNFKYDYKHIDSLDKIEYNVKLILK